MASVTDIDYRDVPVPDDPRDIRKGEHPGGGLVPDDYDGQADVVVRRAYIFQRIQEEGHPSLIDPRKLADQLGVSRRQIYYDIEVLREFISKTLGTRHIADNVSVFEKAKREAMASGDWKGAVEILEKEAEWLERRGAIDKEPEKTEHTWRHYMELVDDEAEEIETIDVTPIDEEGAERSDRRS